MYYSSIKYTLVFPFLFLFLWFKRSWEHGFEWLRETQYHYLETNERRLSRTYVAWSGSIYRMQRLSTKKKTTRGMYQVHKWTRSIIMVGHVARNPGNKGMHAKGSKFVSCPVLIHKSRSKRDDSWSDFKFRSSRWAPQTRQMWLPL